jgi:hypothetical protein
MRRGPLRTGAVNATALFSDLRDERNENAAQEENKQTVATLTIWRRLSNFIAVNDTATNLANAVYLSTSHLLGPELARFSSPKE